MDYIKQGTLTPSSPKSPVSLRSNDVATGVNIIHSSTQLSGQSNFAHVSRHSKSRDDNDDNLTQHQFISMARYTPKQKKERQSQSQQRRSVARRTGSQLNVTQGGLSDSEQMVLD
jgi:hypothetical protein